MLQIQIICSVLEFQDLFSVVRKSGIIVQNGQNQFVTGGESTTRIPKSSSSSALKNLSA